MLPRRLRSKITKWILRQPIFPRWSMEKWLEAGQPHVQKRLKEYGIEFSEDLPVPEDHEEVMRRGGVGGEMESRKWEGVGSYRYQSWLVSAG
ncbi:MAG: hypothetical protein U0X93_08540 [Anaerolineales bacterium]